MILSLSIVQAIAFKVDIANYLLYICFIFDVEENFIGGVVFFSKTYRNLFVFALGLGVGKWRCALSFVCLLSGLYGFYWKHADLFTMLGKDHLGSRISVPQMQVATVTANSFFLFIDAVLADVNE